MSIGEFARLSRLSPKALRLYDELALLEPARVDDDSGYRYYSASQLDRAQLIAALRQLQIPLAEIKSIVDLEPDAAAARITEHWNAIEAQHAARRDLARYLIDRMQGKRHAMYQVATRDIPARSVLSVKRSVEGIDGTWAFGKEFISILRNHDLPRMDGRAGAFYCIWWGEVNDDSDGPLECRLRLRAPNHLIQPGRGHPELVQFLAERQPTIECRDHRGVGDPTRRASMTSRCLGAQLALGAQRQPSSSPATSVRPSSTSGTSARSRGDVL